MISKNEVKYIQSLNHKKARQNLNLFIVEGPKLLSELLESSFDIQKIYTSSEEIFQTVKNRCNDVLLINDTDLKRISHLETPNKVLCIVKQPKWIEPDFNDCFFIVLDGIQDPGNMGTIIRLADWFGIENIVASVDSANCFNQKVVQASMGSVFRIKVFYKQLESFLSQYKFEIIGATLSGQRLLDANLPASGALVIGNESMGIRPSIKSFISKEITIPKKGKAESLNAAVATGIILSHLIK